MLLLTCPSTGTTAKASSVLNKNNKLYGPMNALDTSKQSTWYSDGQSDGNVELSFVVNFHRPVIIEEIRLQFQGGFAAEECVLYASKSGDSADWIELDETEIEPENINSMQIFPLKDDDEEKRKCDCIKMCLNSTTDFYGRVIIYKFEIWGKDGIN
mmetsp:Transcript_8545/g.10801  ORF Transcript_8545/g.10801 Transcript_8545/m.10801 type:complete len:156 (+) Transcript_8545:102-569(+)